MSAAPPPNARADGVHVVHAPDGLPPDGAVPALAPEARAATRPDACLVDVRGGATHARVSVWASRPVPLPPGTLGAGAGATAAAIGHAAWPDARTGAALLARAADWLAAAGARYAVGPMDGSTWHAYRVVTDASPEGRLAPEPPFALEPTPPPAVADAFYDAGFAPVAHYLSSLVDALPDASESVRRRRARCAARGIGLAPVAPDALDDAMEAVYQISLAAFAANPFYTPLARDAFQATYRPLLPHLDPRLIWLARDATGAAVGFAFGVPDLAQAARGEAVDTVLVKTVAVEPGRRARGVGAALVGEVHEAARRAGYRRAIHALMHDANASVRISAHTARPIRRYALLGRALPGTP